MTTAFEIARGPSGPLLALSIAIETAADRAAAAAEYAALAELFGEIGQEDFTPAIVVSCDTQGVLAPAPLTHDTHGVSLSERLAAFIDDARSWLADGRGQPPTLTVYLPIALTAPASWQADLQQLDVRLILAGDAVATDTAVPAADDAAFASRLEDAFDNFDGKGTGIKAARRENELWLLRWGRPAGTDVAFRRDTAPPVVLLVPPLAAAPITREVDGATFSDVELDVFASRFLAALDGISPRSDEIAAIRRDLAAAIAETIAPAWRAPGDAFNASAAVDGVRRMLEQDLTLASRAASIAQISATVESRIASGRQPEPEWRLNGAISGAGAHAMSTGGVPLTAGEPTIELMLVPADPAAAMSIDLDPVFNPLRLEETGAAPLQLPVPPSLPLGSVTMPVPLRTPPEPLHVREAEGAQDDDSGASGLQPRWRCSLTIDVPVAAQDAVGVAVAFNGSAAMPARGPATDLAPAQAALFDAIARFIVAHTGGARDVVARARAVVDAWQRWTPDAVPTPAPIEEGALTYALSLDADGAAVLVEATGASAGPEVWPTVIGYSMEPPDPGVRRARFVPTGAAPSGSVTLAFGSLDSKQIRRARAHFWIDRNREVAPTGYQLDPRFIRRGPIATVDAVPPTLRNRAPIVLPAASSLIVSLQDLVAAIGSPAAAEMTIAYSFSIAPGLKTRIPVLMVSRETGTSTRAAAEIGHTLAAWREQASPPETDGAFEFEIKTWADDETNGGAAPQFWFTDVSLEVSGAPGWWDVGRGSGQAPVTGV